MQSARHMPDRERLSSVMAVILLAYVAARFVSTPGQTLGFELAGIYLPLQISVSAIVAVIVAGLTASGADWLLQAEAITGQSRFRHWLLPAMTAWVLSLLLSSLAFDLRWWAALALSAALILAVIYAEFASASEANQFQAVAVQALAVLTLSLFLILAITIRATGLRLYLALPMIALGIFVAGSRLQLLRPATTWQPLQAGGISFIGIQIAAALHYLPVTPLGYGLMMLGILFALDRYTAALNTELPGQAMRQALIAGVIFWALGILVR